MKKKLFLLLIMIFTITFGINNVSAEENMEYKSGDLVEVINPDGGESLKFYVIRTNETTKHLMLLSKEKYKQEIVFEDSDKNLNLNGNEKFKYIKKLEGIISKQALSFIQDLHTPLFACEINVEEYVAGEYGQTVYMNCPEYYDNFLNSYTYGMYEDYYDGVFEKSNNSNYKYMVTNYKLDDSNFKERKLNYHLTLGIEKQNYNILKKVEEIKENNEQSANNNIPTTTKDEVANPKTSDANPYIIIGFTLVGVAAIIISRKKIIKLK